MTSMIRRSPLRRKLVLTTALAGSVVALTGTAHAQNTPSGPTVVTGAGVTFNGGAPALATGAPTTLNVNLAANPNTIIEWANFDVSAGSTVDFNSSLGALPAAVLNRVTGGTMSNIQGSITSDANVAVWLVNPNGIMIDGAGASISTGSFVGSTIGITNAQFTGATGSFNLTGGGAGGIVVQNGATITTAAGNRGLVLVAPSIDADGDFDAGARDVAFITATDVTLNYGLLGGPLQVTLNAGTAVTGASQVVQGTVAGRHVYFALASQAAVTDALLDVDAAVTATTAAASGTGIVLSAGASSGPVSLGGGDVAGIAGIAANGSLTATGTAGGIAVTSTGLTAITGNVTGDANFTVSGATVELGNDPDAELMAVDGTIDITSTAGDINGGAGLALRSDANGNGAGDLFLDSAAAIAMGGTSVQAGSAGTALVGLRAVGAITLGDVTAERIGTLNGAHTNVALALTHAGGNVQFGAVDVTDDIDFDVIAGNFTALDIEADDIAIDASGLIQTGNATATTGGGDIVMTAGGTMTGATYLAGSDVLLNALAITLGGATGTAGDIDLNATAGNVGLGSASAGDDVIVNATGTASIANAVGAGGDYLVTGFDVTLGDDAGAEVQSAGGTIVITGTGGTITGGENLTLRANGTGNLTLTTGAAATGGDILFDGSALLQGGASGTQRDVIVTSRDASNLVTLGDVTARGLQGSVGAGAVTNGITRGASIVTGDVTLVNTLALTSTAGDVTTGAISVSGVNQGITLSAANGTLTAPGTLGASGNIALTGGNTLTFGNITSTAGSVTATSVSGALTTGAVSGQTGVALGAQGNVIATSASAATGGVTLTSTAGDVTLGNASGLGTVSVSALAGTATVNGNVTSQTGQYRVIAQTVSLGADGDAEVQQAGGIVDITATSGAISGGTGLTLRSDSNGAGNEPLYLDGAGGIALAGATIQGGPAGGASVGIRMGTGQTVALGDVTGAVIGQVDALRTAISPIVHDASITFGNVTATGGAFDVSLSTGSLATGNVSEQNVTLAAGSGAITTGGLTGGSITATASGALSVASASAATGALTLTSTGGSVAVGNASALTDVAVSAAASATIAGNVTAGGNYAVSGASVNLGVDGDAEVQQAAGAVTITAYSGPVTGGTGLLLRGNSDDVGAELLTLSLGAGASLAFGAAEIQGGANRSSSIRIEAIDAAPALVFGNVSGSTFQSSIGAGGLPNALVTGGGVTTGNLDFSAELRISGNGITTGSVNSGSFSELNAGTGPLAVNGPVTAAGQFVASGSSVSFGGGVAAGAGVSVSSPGAVTGSSISAVGGLTISGSAIAATTLTATGGALALTATGGGITIDSGTAATAALGATGAVSVTTGLTTSGNASITGASAALAPVTSTGGSVSVTTTSGGYTAFGGGRADVTAANDITLAIAGPALIGTLDAGGAIGLTAASLDATTLGGASVTATGGSIAIGTASSGGLLDLSAATGDLTLGTGTAGTTATIDAGRDVVIGTGLTAGGAVMINAGRDVRLAQVTATNGALQVVAAGQVSGATVGARGNLIAGGANALSVTAGDAVLLGTANGRGVTISGDAVDVGTIAAGSGIIDLDATAGAIALGSGTATGAATFDATDAVALGAVSAGPGITVTASDAALSGTLDAATVRLTNRSPSVVLRLGDDLGAGGFALSQAEIGLIDADTLVLDGGSGAVEIGTLAFDADAGRDSLSVLATGDMDITGTLSGSGTGRLFRFGGDATASSLADQIRIVSTTDAGGRLLFASSDVELAGGRIVMGLAPGFVDVVLGGTPLSVGEVAGRFISNPNSALYSSILSGQNYADKTILAANSLTVRFGEYALFQNTEVAGLTGGVVLGGAATTPVLPALTIDGSGSAGIDGFAMFGTVNGTTGTAAALLGPSAIVVNAVDPQSARLNGCLIGSGAGCLTSVVTQPTLNVFDSSRLDVLRTAEDLSLPFDPVVGTNNEALFSGAAAVDTPVDGDECAADPEAAECAASEEEPVQ